MRRISQRDLLPIAVKSRNLANFNFGSEEGSAQVTLANTEQVIITSSISQDQKYEIFGNNYIAVYIGSIAPENELPGGSAVDESQWQVIGPFFSHSSWNSSGFARYLEYSKLYIRNISAGSQLVIFKNKWRYLSPRESSTA